MIILPIPEILTPYKIKKWRFNERQQYIIHNNLHMLGELKGENLSYDLLNRINNDVNKNCYIKLDDIHIQNMKYRIIREHRSNDNSIFILRCKDDLKILARGEDDVWYVFDSYKSITNGAPFNKVKYFIKPVHAFNLFSYRRYLNVEG